MYQIQTILNEAEKPLSAKQIADYLENTIKETEPSISFNAAESKALRYRVRSALNKLLAENLASRVAEYEIKNLITFKWKTNEIELERKAK